MNHKYRKKPVVIEAFQMTQERRLNRTEWPEWLNEAWDKKPDEVGWVGPVSDHLGSYKTGHLQICTLEGMMLVNWGDFIIKGIASELYPCKPDIFEKTYEKVD